MNDFSDLSDVKTKWHPPEGLFTSKNFKKIAIEVYKGHKNDLKSSIASINFYMNRGGSNLSKETKEILEKAKDYLREMNDRKHKDFCERLDRLSKLILNSN